MVNAETSNGYEHNSRFKDNPTTSWWLDNMKDRSLCVKAETDVPEYADIAIVGAGMSGCSVAYHLACQSYIGSVVLLDARGVAGGASGRNGGHLTPDQASEFERETTQELLAFIEQTSTKCDLVRGGKVKLRERCEDEYDEELVDESYQFYPAKVCESLLRVGSTQNSETTLKLVAPIYVNSIETVTHEEEEVQNVQWQRRLEDSTTRSGVLYAKKVVVCLNGWTSTLLPEFNSVFYSGRNQVIMTKPLNQEMLKNWARNGIGCWGKLEGEIYGILRQDNRICIGGARALEPNKAINNSDDSTLSKVVGEHLRERLKKLLDCNDDIPVEAEWTGVLV